MQQFKKTLVVTCIFLATNLIAIGQITYPDNESGIYDDMLTPRYYEDSVTGAFRSEINKFVYFARLLPFQHPLKDSLTENPSFILHREFGDEMGRFQPVQHHPADDYHPENRATELIIYAAHDGYANIYRDAPKYRHYIAVIKDVEDDNGKIIGKISTIYGHVDLDLDSLEGLNVRDKFVKKGEVISQHLYEGTVGGPHLHFEIRYYRPNDAGTEDFYGIAAMNPEYTVASSGRWKYGSWQPDVGYGFAHPENHLNASLTGAFDINSKSEIQCFPNPVKDWLTIQSENQAESVEIIFYNIHGSTVKMEKSTNGSEIYCDLRDLSPGPYILSIENVSGVKSMIILKE